MKRSLLYFISIVLMGCDSFLEETSQDEVRPSMVNDLDQILVGDGYQEGNFYYLTEIFTDNIESVGVFEKSLQSVYNQQKWLYIWSDNMFDEDGGGYDERVWEIPYAGILGCNLVLDYLDEMNGDDGDRESLRGEALILRSWYYFHLVNFFGIAYNQGNPEKDLGVPLKLHAEVTGEYFQRNTVKEVYDQVINDLLEGNRLLAAHEYQRNFFRMDDLAAKSILSRVYLYMEDWDKAILYADSVLMRKADLLDLNTFIGKLPGNTATVYSTDTPDEIIWGREHEGAYDSDPMTSLLPFSVSENLSGLFVDSEYVDFQQRQVGDLRGFYFKFKRNLLGDMSWGRYAISKGKGADGGLKGGFQGIRVAELYLNRAEAYAQKYLLENNDSYRKAALSDLNLLRKYRLNKNIYEEVDLVDAQELLDFCLEERRRELCGETNHRWCDLRRYGKTVTHVLMGGTSLQTYEQDMGKYVLPIPEDVMTQNPGLLQN